MDKMFSEGIRNLTDANSDKDAWETLFRYINQKKGIGNISYTAGERISIKVNLANNKWGTYEHEDNDIDANPYLILSLLNQLTNKVGVPEENITVFDVSKPMHHWFYNILSKEYPNVYYADLYGEAEGRHKVNSSEKSVFFTWGKCKNRTLPECVVDTDYLINIPILKRHPTGHGISLSGKNLFGAFAEPVEPIHPYLVWGTIMGNPSPQVELLGHEDLGGKTLLYIGDATFATKQTIKNMVKFDMYPFDNDWTNSLFFSQDPVAIDSVMYDFLRLEGTNPRKGSHNYLHQAAVPPINRYDPENDGIFLSESLGVHEHCNEDVDIFSKERYSGPENNGIDYIAIGKEHAKFSVDIKKPTQKTLYLFGRMIKPLRNIDNTMIFGKIRIIAKINGIDESPDYVAFYVNDELKKTLYKEPFEWTWFGSKNIKLSSLKVKAYKDAKVASEEIKLYKFF